MSADKPLLLLVDDTPSNLDTLREILAATYSLRVALDGQRALDIAAAEPQPALILLDVMMPKMDGYEVCRRLKRNPFTSHIPVVFVTAMGETEDETRGFEAGGVDYVIKPVSPPIVLARVKTHLSLSNQKRHLAQLVDERTAQLARTQREIVNRLGRAAEYKDDETGAHVMRISHYARLLAEAAGAHPDWCECLFFAAPMHDIGKIGIPDSILQKSTDLSAEEWVVMRRHTIIGAEIIGDDDAEVLTMARSVALHHHERWNGEGYPQGLVGENIPLEARIVMIADVFDALTTERPYKKAWPVEDAVKYMKVQSGLLFDPTLLQLFLDRLPQVMEIKDRHPESRPLKASP
jgi:putative two-component system response regulator